jgi:hypothetical protein
MKPMKMLKQTRKNLGSLGKSPCPIQNKQGNLWKDLCNLGTKSPRTLFFFVILGNSNLSYYGLFYLRTILDILGYSTLGYFRLFYLGLFFTIVHYFNLGYFWLFLLFQVIPPINLGYSIWGYCTLSYSTQG